MPGERIPFGKRGIKDAEGNIIRTDHPTMFDVVTDMLNRITRGGTQTDERTRRFIGQSGVDVEEMKAMQDRLAGIKRNL